ncbi:hypothetical protein GC173_11870 [bacterium]|nr:hypothetical protein [bacterium]
MRLDAMTGRSERLSDHAVSVDATPRSLGAIPRGLAAEGAAIRLEKHGANRLPEPPKRDQHASDQNRNCCV